MTRRWFQIHLSTAMILTIIASVLLLANITSFINGPLITGEPAFIVLDDPYKSPLNTRGWPLRYLVYVAGEPYWMYWSLAVDSLVAITALSLTAITLESIIRRERGRT